jgi:cytochrome-b5 reductase
MIAGGAGITPMYQLIRGILKNPEERTKITLVWGVNTDADVMLRKEFDEFEAKYPGRFKAHYTVSNPVEGSPYNKGYITKDILQKAMPGPEEKDNMVFLCGPPALESSVAGNSKRSNNGESGILAQMGYTKDRVHKF